MSEAGAVAYVRWHASLVGFECPDGFDAAAPLEDLLRERTGAAFPPYEELSDTARDSVILWAFVQADEGVRWAAERGYQLVPGLSVPHEYLRAAGQELGLRDRVSWKIVTRLRRWLRWPGACQFCGATPSGASGAVIGPGFRPACFPCSDFPLIATVEHPVPMAWYWRRAMSRDWVCLWAICQWMDEKPERWQALHDWRPPWRTVGEVRAVAPVLHTLDGWVSAHRGQRLDDVTEEQQKLLAAQLSQALDVSVDLD